MEMVQAATQAAQAAAASAQSVAQLVSRTEASSSPSATEGTSSFQAYKLLKHPDSFGSESTDHDAVQWGAWLHGFRTWLSVVNPAYESELLEIEARCSEPCMAMDLLPDPTKSRSRQLYGILSTLLKGRPLQVLRLTHNQHGYEVMHVLHQTFQPRTRSRAMAIITAIMATPAFNKQSTIREQVHAFERACSEYLKASGKEVSEDVKFSILLRSLPKYLRDHINLSLSEDTSYDQVREQILQFENVTQSWNPTRVQQQLLMPSLPSAAHQSSDMDVDAEGAVAQVKGKGKDKGKGKPKGKEGKGGGSTSTADANTVCHYCQKKGHFQRDCRKMRADQSARDRARVQQVEDAHPPANAASPTRSVKAVRIDLTSEAPVAASGVASIRAMSYQSSPEVPSDAVFDPSSPVSSDAVFDPSSPVSSSAVSVPRRQEQCPEVCCAVYSMTASDHDGRWTLMPGPEPDPEVHVPIDGRVWAVNSSFSSDGDVVVCVDTAADESCIPYSCFQVGTHSAQGPRGLVDASGNAMQTRGVRHASLQVGDVEIVDLIDGL